VAKTKETGKKDKAKAVLPVMDEWLRFQTYVNEIPSVSVGVFLEDEVIFRKSYGYVNLQTRRKATPDTMYRIASHSKLFTATALMRLQAAGELRLDDRVSDHLCWFESKKDENVAHITLRQLLTHSSGLVRDGRTQHWGDDRFPDEEQVVEQVQAGVTVQNGYEHWKYSNFGYTILGQVIAATTGKSYEEAVMELVVKPLRMTQTYPDILPKHQKYHATGYGKRFPERGRAELAHVRARAMNSATGFSSTVQDLLRFYQAHLLGSDLLLNDRDRREMQRVQYKDKQYEWGLGFGLSTAGGWDMAGHGGGYKGFITSSALNQANRMILVVLTSAVDGPAQNLRTGMLGLLKKAIEDHDKFSPERKVPPETMKAICGFYQSDWGIWQYGDVNGKLVGLAPDSDDPAVELLPYEHTGKLQFRTPLLTDQNTTYHEDFRFEMTPAGRVSRLVEPGMVSKPFRFR
jgi:D-alanyl-D-alanine carboxypeptidase